MRLVVIVLLLGFTVIGTNSADQTRLSIIPKQPRLGPDQSVIPEKGVFLVAKRSMPDPRFRETVVLLLAHGDGGTLGVIINRPTDIPFSEALPDLSDISEENHTLFFGGPVALDRLVFLMRAGTPPTPAEHVMADVYYSASRDVLEGLLKQSKGARELRMFVGHSGWSPGQLASEIARGDWLLVRADARTVFEKELDEIWPELIHESPPPEMIIERDGPGAEVLIAGVTAAGCRGDQRQCPPSGRS